MRIPKEGIKQYKEDLRKIRSSGYYIQDPKGQEEDGLFVGICMALCGVIILFALIG